MGKGTLVVQLSTNDGAMPIEGAQIKILDVRGNLLHDVTTDMSGKTERIVLPAPPKETQFDPNQSIRPYDRYMVIISAPGYRTDVINGVQIFDESDSVLPINMLPGTSNQVDEFDIGRNALEMRSQSGNQAAPPMPNPLIHREVFIPTYITVHLGVPSSNARNVTVPFVDYLKNVASSEIYPTWPYHALRANIHAQISIALNRVFTEWYRGKGFNFDITNSTQYDQYFVENRNIYDSVSRVVDEIFNTYIIRPPGIEPYYAEYCNGTTATCPGMKQWGTVTLAEQGRSYLEILRYYYGQSIYITSTDNIQTPFESFPGNLAIGATGQDVAMIQMMLARIRRNYPRIPALSVDGQYGSQTVASVREFQSIFGLPVTGTVDRRTWYQISNIYAAVMKLAELGGEGHVPPSIELPTVPPTSNYFNHTVVAGDTLWLLAQRYGTTVDEIMSLNGLTSSNINIGQVLRIPGSSGSSVNMPAFPGTLRSGSRGDYVTILQQGLNWIADRNSAVPRITADGIFGPATQAAVIAFQRNYGLTPDGIVGQLTWNRLRDLTSG